MQFTVPELQDSHLIEWDLHVTKDLGAHDVIIGRDLLEFLKIDIKFSTQTVEWGIASMPFKDPGLDPAESYHIKDPDGVKGQCDRVKRILEAKCAPANLTEVCNDQDHLTKEQQQKLCNLLDTHKKLFDGTLGTWRGSEVDSELKPDAQPHHARPFLVPKCHEETLHTEAPQG